MKIYKDNIEIEPKKEYLDLEQKLNWSKNQIDFNSFRKIVGDKIITDYVFKYNKSILLNKDYGQESTN